MGEYCALEKGTTPNTTHPGGATMVVVMLSFLFRGDFRDGLSSDVLCLIVFKRELPPCTGFRKTGAGVCGGGVNLAILSSSLWPKP